MREGHDSHTCRDEGVCVGDVVRLCGEAELVRAVRRCMFDFDAVVAMLQSARAVCDDEQERESAGKDESSRLTADMCRVRYAQCAQRWRYV